MPQSTKRQCPFSVCTNIHSQREEIRKDSSHYFILVAFIFSFLIYCLFHIYSALNKKGAIRRHNWKIQKKANTERQKKNYQLAIFSVRWYLSLQNIKLLTKIYVLVDLLYSYKILLAVVQHQRVFWIKSLLNC